MYVWLCVCVAWRSRWLETLVERWFLALEFGQELVDVWQLRRIVLLLSLSEPKNGGIWVSENGVYIPRNQENHGKWWLINELRDAAMPMDALYSDPFGLSKRWKARNTASLIAENDNVTIKYN